MSLLSIIQATCDRLSLNRPSAVVASSDKLVRQLMGIANEAGESLSRRGVPGWQALIEEHAFVTVALAEQSNTPIPSDLRRFVPDSFFNRSTGRQVVGPMTSQDWQNVQANGVAASIYLTYRERGGTFLISPVPTAGETIAYEYVSKYWVRSSVGVAKAAFTVDEDETYLDEELLILEIRWRWKQAKGLDYGEDMATAERAIVKALGEDGSAGSISLEGVSDIYAVNVPISIPV